MEIYGRIYKITNTVNNKIYVGQTINDIQYRFKQHLNSGHGIIHRAIKKHGKDKFFVTELQECYFKDGLDYAEMVWVKKLNTVSPSGYNLTGGGKAGGK